MGDNELVDNLKKAWASIAQLGAELQESQWKAGTDCPGWSVQDQLSHLVGTEARLLGRSAPEHVPDGLRHVKNEIGERNEVQVDWRRPWAGTKSLEEFLEVTGQRLRTLRGMTTQDFAAETQTPLGPGTVADLLRIRIMDTWVHEQDMRRAVGRPGNLDGPVAAHSVGHLAAAMPYVVGRKVKPPDGATVVFQVNGPAGRTLAIAMEGSRANPLEDTPPAPTVRLSMDVETFACLSCGRWQPETVLQSGKVKIEGDTSLGETIVSQMNIMV